MHLHPVFDSLHGPKMKSPYLFLLLVLTLTFFSCSSEKPGDAGKQPLSPGGAASAPVTAGTGNATGNTGYLLEIGPKEPVKNTTLSVIMKGFDLSDTKVEWLVNGIPAPDHISTQFKCADAKKGDVVQCKAISKGVEIRSNEVKIKNTPPEIVSVKIAPEVNKPGEPLSVDVTGSDADGDPVTFLYEWTKNGKPAGTTNRIEGDVKRGDKISLKITPYDGEEYGRPKIVTAGIQNMPPVITEHNNFNFDGKVLTYQVKASDPDGDPLTYSLKKASPGMAIDVKTGLMTWNVPADFKGKTSCVISVKDGQGGEAEYTLNIDIGDFKK